MHVLNYDHIHRQGIEIAFFLFILKKKNEKAAYSVHYLT